MVKNKKISLGSNQLRTLIKVVGDPTVEIFGSRDIDSFLQDREAFAVQVNKLQYR